MRGPAGSTDLEIARSVPMRALEDVARLIGLGAADLERHGRSLAKVRLDLLERLPPRAPGRYFVVTSMTPTPLGEGKSVHAIGVSMAFNRLGRRAACTLRQPSMAAFLGSGGGGSVGAGGGRCQVVPPERVNLHLTGDAHAVAAAHDLLAAFAAEAAAVVPESIVWRRVIDAPGAAGFQVPAASEVMAVLALASSRADLRQRLGRIAVGRDRGGAPVTAEDLRAAGAMAVLLSDAIEPTLLQTLEGTPALIHTGSPADLGLGSSSVVADVLALGCCERVITEAGCGAELGAEKFFNIKCRRSGLRPDAAILCATVRALKVQSGRFGGAAGAGRLPDGLLEADLDAVRAGAPNLQKQIENVRLHGVPVVVAINRFASDTDAELDLARGLALDAGASAAHVSTLFADGGAAGAELAEALDRAADDPSTFRFLYPEDAPLLDKIEAVATKVYGAAGVELSAVAREELARLEDLGCRRLPISMVKTRLSLSHDAAQMGCPAGFVLPVHAVRASFGAGFVSALTGPVETTPDLGPDPRAARLDLDADGRVVEL